MGISYRLKYIAGLVTPGYKAADIGTDHGYVPLYLVREGISPSAIAVDISRDSLIKAEKLAAKAGLTDRIECRLSDGFAKLSPGEADSVIISGMGGILMSNIMEAHPEVLESFKEIIASPHRDADLVKTVIAGHGFRIVIDEMITDKKKTYPVIKAVRERRL